MGEVFALPIAIIRDGGMALGVNMTLIALGHLNTADM
jgi:hypothetical protein